MRSVGMYPRSWAKRWKRVGCTITKEAGGNGVENELTKYETKVWDNLRRANAGEVGALTLCEADLSGPNRAELLNVVGDLGNQVQESLLKAAFDGDEGTKLLIRAKMTAMKEELQSKGCSTIESLLIDRICVTWLDLHIAELRLSQNAKPSVERRFQERVDRCHRRYLSAIRSLATTRKLSLRVDLRVAITKTQNAIE
jgi:hypothetical protein